MVNLAAVDLNQLLVLHTVLEEGSVTRAARRLHVTPPAISNALARLRAQLDDPLFVRSGRSLAPTPRALEIAPLLSRVVADVETALRGPERDPAETTRELTIALADPDQIASLPRLVSRLLERMPRAKLRVVSIDTLISGGGLEGAGADAAIGPAESAVGLHAAPLYEDEGVLVVRKDHPIVRRAIDRERFLALRHVDVHLALGRAGAGHRVAEDTFEKQTLSRDIALTVPTFSAAAMVVAESDLVAGMPRRLAEALAPLANLRIVDAAMMSMRFRMQLLWHERTHHDPVCRMFREVVIDALGDPPRPPQRRLRASGGRR